jgi:hypothetical protein
MLLEEEDNTDRMSLDSIINHALKKGKLEAKKEIQK